MKEPTTVPKVPAKLPKGSIEIYKRTAKVIELIIAKVSLVSVSKSGKILGRLEIFLYLH